MFPESHFEDLDYRRYWIQKFSYAIPNDEALDLILSYSPIVEMGAGLGYWAYLLDQKGCDIVAYDIDPIPVDNKYLHIQAVPWYKVKKCWSNFVPPRNKTLFICWPPYNNNMAANILKKYKGSIFIYIGEQRDGCCATDTFFDELAKWNEIEKLDIPQFEGIHDKLLIYERSYS